MTIITVSQGQLGGLQQLTADLEVPCPLIYRGAVVKKHLKTADLRHDYIHLQLLVNVNNDLTAFDVILCHDEDELVFAYRVRYQAREESAFVLSQPREA